MLSIPLWWSSTPLCTIKLILKHFFENLLEIVLSPLKRGWFLSGCTWQWTITFPYCVPPPRERSRRLWIRKLGKHEKLTFCLFFSSDIQTWLESRGLLLGEWENSVLGKRDEVTGTTNCATTWSIQPFRSLYIVSISYKHHTYRARPIFWRGEAGQILFSTHTRLSIMEKSKRRKIV